VAEGDTIMRLALRMQASLAGERIRAACPSSREPEGRPVASLDGRALESAESRGKHLLLRFSEGLVLHSHLGMKGAWHLYRPGERWRLPPSRAWISISGERAEAVNFSGTSMRIVRESELARDRRLARLGPDVLAPELSEERAAAALRGAGPEAELGEALLDQTLLAGIGNIFKSEGCFAAEINPWRRLGDLSDTELRRVAGATRELMLTAVRSGRAPRSVHRRAGMPCPSCRGPIESRAQGDAARITYWCPRCQR